MSKTEKFTGSLLQDGPSTSGNQQLVDKIKGLQDTLAALPQSFSRPKSKSNYKSTDQNSYP